MLLTYRLLFNLRDELQLPPHGSCRLGRGRGAQPDVQSYELCIYEMGEQRTTHLNA